MSSQTRSYTIESASGRVEVPIVRLPTGYSVLCPFCDVGIHSFIETRAATEIFHHLIREHPELVNEVQGGQ